MNLRRAPVDLSAAPIPALAALGLTDDGSDQTGIAQIVRLDNVATIWLFALLAQLAAWIVTITAAAMLGVRAVLVEIVIAGAVVVALSLVTFAFLSLPVVRTWPSHQRNRCLGALAAGLSAGLLALLWITTSLPLGAIQLGSFVAVAGAIGITTVSLHPVRAATLGFGAGLVATLAALSDQIIPIVISAVFLAALVAATLRLARLDLQQLRTRADEASEGRLAAKMIAEFEGHGTGWFWEADRQGHITYLSAKVAGELAAHGGSPIGRQLTDVFRMDSATPGTERTLAFHISSRTSFSDYSVCATDDDTAERWWSISGRPAVDELGRFQGFIGSGSDLTEKRKSEAEITRLALFDSLTGLANRQRMRITLEKTLVQQVGLHRPSALFLMDLDRFKAVNDTLGHQAGDTLLKHVAQRLQRVVGDAGLVGRLGGDEFQVLLPGIDNRETLSTLAKELIAALSQPYFISSNSVTIGCSIGVALAPVDGEDAETLTRNADLALYAAKGDGRGVHRFYSENMLAGAKSRKQLEDDMRTALTEGAFHLVYQPVVSTRDARVTGFEALLRWDHPTRGAISPADFVPVAEECGLIEALGEWVLRTACDQAARWPHDVRVAVNVSPIQFANPVLPALVTSALANSGLDPARLELEITEGVFLDETQSSDRMFKALKGIGVRLALDDFGTGYSSLGYLRTAPFDKIKIDQSFVRGAAQPGNRNAAIIKAIVTLADTLGMETTAEGVEIQDEIDLVRGLGCSHIQGYVYGRGMRAEQVAIELGGGVQAIATGHKVSRAPRTKMLRSARMEIGSAQGDVRIRNISTSGAMIDGIVLDEHAVGFEVLIELLEDQMFAARVAWARDGKAGLEFSQSFNLDRLNQLSPARTMRRAG